MSVTEPRIIDEIGGKYDGRKVKRIQRENGKVDFKVRKRATKRRHVVTPKTVKTDYWLDPEQDIIEVEDQDGEKRIYLVPVSSDLQVHRATTVHQQKMQELEESFDRDEQLLDELKRENRRLKRRLARQSDGEDEETEEQSSAPKQQYECQICGNTMTEKQKEEHDDRCSQCNREELELMD